MATHQRGADIDGRAAPSGDLPGENTATFHCVFLTISRRASGRAGEKWPQVEMDGCRSSRPPRRAAKTPSWVARLQRNDKNPTMRRPTGEFMMFGEYAPLPALFGVLPRAICRSQVTWRACLATETIPEVNELRPENVVYVNWPRRAAALN